MGSTMPTPSRFLITCRLLREAGWLDIQILNQRPRESPVDWMVRQGLVNTPERAAEALLAGKSITSKMIDDVEQWFSAIQPDGEP